MAARGRSTRPPPLSRSTPLALSPRLLLPLALLLAAHVAATAADTATDTATDTAIDTAIDTATDTAGVRLFVFGDSTVDVGNNNYIKTILRANFAPYGIDFRPKSGRFSNGKIIVDFLAKHMGIRSPPAYLQPKKNTLFGVNFASGGAGVLNDTYSRYGTIPLLAQLENFATWKQANNVSSADLSKSVFLVSVGPNDYMEYFRNTSSSKPAIQPFVGSIINGILDALQRLVAQGARKVVVLLMPPLGCIPAVRFSVLGTAAGLNTCVPELNALAIAHNGAMIASLTSAFPVGEGKPTVMRFNMYNAVSDVVATPAAYGFGQNLAACCGAPRPTNGAVQCGTTDTVNGTRYRSRLCLNRSRRIFWDHYHPSQNLNRVIANMLWSGEARYAFPVNLQGLVAQ